MKRENDVEVTAPVVVLRERTCGGIAFGGSITGKRANERERERDHTAVPHVDWRAGEGVVQRCNARPSVGIRGRRDGRAVQAIGHGILTGQEHHQHPNRKKERHEADADDDDGGGGGTGTCVWVGCGGQVGDGKSAVVVDRHRWSGCTTKSKQPRRNKSTPSRRDAIHRPRKVERWHCRIRRVCARGGEDARPVPFRGGLSRLTNPVFPSTKARRRRARQAILEIDSGTRPHGPWQWCWWSHGCQ